jgi:hypothetical protein
MASKTITKNIMSLDEFPVLGTNISKDQERNIRLSNVSTREEKVETIDKEEQVYKKHESNDSFLFTKPCKNVTDNTKEEEFGVCTRSVCTFAHSIEEFRIPKCRFMSNCRSSNCKFLHPDETTDEWTLRTGEKLPHLPLTNVSSRQPSDHVNSKDFDSHTDLPNISLPVYDPRFQDPRVHDPRFHDPRFQDPRFHDPRVHDPRFQDPRFQDPRFHNPRVYDPRFHDPRFHDPRFHDPRVHDPRVHDTRFQDPRVHDTRVHDTRVHDTRVYDTLFQNTQVYDHMIDNRINDSINGLADKRPIQVPNSLFQNTIPQIVTKPKPYNKKFEIELQFLNSEGKLSYITVPTKELALIALQAGFDNGNNEVKMCKVYR